MTTDEKIGVIVERWIKASRYKKVDIAKRLTIPQANISQFLKGTRPFPLPRLIQIIKLLQPPLVDIDEINSLKYQDIALSIFAKTDIKSFDNPEQVQKLIDNIKELHFQDYISIPEYLGAACAQWKKDGGKIELFHEYLIGLYHVLSPKKKDEFKHLIYESFGNDLKAWYDKKWCKYKKPETPDQGNPTS